MTLDLFSLQCFVDVAQTRHFGNSARSLFISQAQLSKRVRDLEAELGTVLLDRTTRRVELTEAGAEVLVEARQILAHVTALEEGVRRVAQGEVGHLSLGVVGSTTFTILPKIMRVLSRLFPDVDISVVAELLTPAQERMLRDRTIDVGILRLPVRMTGLRWRVLDRDPLVIAVPQGHRLADKQGPVDMRLFRDDPFIGYPASSGSVVRDAAIRQCAAAGFEPHVVVEVSETSTMLGLVSAGIGVALVPRSAHRMAVDDVHLLDLIRPTHVEIALAWRDDDTSPLLRRFLATLEAEGLFLEPHNQTPGDLP